MTIDGQHEIYQIAQPNISDLFHGNSRLLLAILTPCFHPSVYTWSECPYNILTDCISKYSNLGHRRAVQDQVGGEAGRMGHAQSVRRNSHTTMISSKVTELTKFYLEL